MLSEATQLIGVEAYSRFGHAMASLGDISGDGFDGELRGEGGRKGGRLGGSEEGREGEIFPPSRISPLPGFKPFKSQ